MNHRKIKGIIIALMLCIMFVFPASASAANSISGYYDADKAVSFASDIIQHLQYDSGACSWYVSKCLQVGGLDIDPNDFRVVGNLLDALTAPSKGKAIASKVQTSAKTLEKAEPGDLIFVGNKGRAHVLIVTKVNVKKDDKGNIDTNASTITFSQNNGFHHQESVKFYKVIDPSKWWWENINKSFLVHIGDSARCLNHDYDSDGKCSKCGTTYNYVNTRRTHSGVIFANGGQVVLYSKPYSDKVLIIDGKRKTCTTQIQVLATVKNAFDETWYEVQLSGGMQAYVYCPNTDSGKKGTPFFLSGIYCEDMAYPKSYYEAKESTSVDITKGKVYSSYPISSFTAEIYKLDTVNGVLTEKLLKLNKVNMQFVKTNIGTNTLSIKGLKSDNGIDINEFLAFSQLTGQYGSYVYRITIQADPGKNATKEELASCKLVLDYPFIINNSNSEIDKQKSDRMFLRYYTNDGTGKYTTQMLKGGDSVIPPTLTRDGYTFLGWSESAKGDVVCKPGEKYKPANKNNAKTRVVLGRKLYAIWEANESIQDIGETDSENSGIRLLFDPNLDGILNSVMFEPYYGGDLILPTPKRDETFGYEFLGWTVQSEESGLWYSNVRKTWVKDFEYKLLGKLSYMKAGDMLVFDSDFLQYSEKELENRKIKFIFTAQWKKLDSYSVTYDANASGIELSEKSVNVLKGDKFAVSYGPERTGYIFAGWNTKKDGSGTMYQPEKEVKFSEDTTLYAIWKPDNISADAVIAACKTVNTNLVLSITEDCPVYNVPGKNTTYAASKTIDNLKLGDTVSATQILTNVVGNNWYRVTYKSGKEGFIYYTHTSVDSVNAQVKINKEWNPGTVVGGKGKDIDGTISISGKNCGISAVRACVTDGNNEEHVSAYNFPEGKFGTSYKLKSSNKNSVNMKLSFGSFSSGPAVYEVFVDLAAQYITEESEIDYFIDSNISVYPAQNFTVLGPYNFTFEHEDGTATYKNIAYKKTLTIQENNDQKENQIFDGWKLIRIIEEADIEEVNTIDHGWQTLENAESKGYAPVLYGKGSKITVDDNLVGKTGEEAFAFVPVFSEIPIGPVIDDPQNDPENNGEPVLSDLFTITNLQGFDVDGNVEIDMKNIGSMGLGYGKGIMGLLSCDPSINEQDNYMTARLVSDNTSIELDNVTLYWRRSSELLFSFIFKDAPLGSYNIELHIHRQDGTKDLYQSVPINISADSVTITGDYAPLDISYDSQKTKSLIIGDPGSYLKIDEIDVFHQGVAFEAYDGAFDIYNMRGAICSMDSNNMSLCSDESRMVVENIYDSAGNYCNKKFVSLLYDNRLYIAADRSCPAGEYTIELVFGNESDGFVAGYGKFNIYNDSEYQDVPCFEITDYSYFSGRTIAYEKMDEGWCIELYNRGVYGTIGLTDGSVLSEGTRMRVDLLDSNGNEIDYNKKYWGEEVSRYSVPQDGVFAIDVPKHFPSGQYTLVIGLADSNGIYHIQSIPVTF